MKSISYVSVSNEQAIRDFCRGRVVSILANNDFYCAIQRGELRRMKARHMRRFARMIKREMAAAQDLFGGEVTCKSRPSLSR